MSQSIKARWITSIIAEGAAGIPTLPWERAAKRARRLLAAQALANAS